MPTFTIDTDHSITAFETAAQVQQAIPPGGFTVIASTQKEFSKATADWPISRMVELWNSFASAPPFGYLKPVKKFTDRKSATTRIWTEIQKLGAAPAPNAATPAPQAAPKAAKKANATKAAADAPTPTPRASAPPVPREFSKKAVVVDLLTRAGGATLQEIVDATGWQVHTVRGFISTLPKKTGIAITSTRRESDKARVYEAAK